MTLVFFGYACTIYAGFAAAAVFQPGRHVIGLLTWWPMLVIGVSSQVFAFRGSDVQRVDEAFRRGTVRRLSALAAGAAAGAGVIAVAATLTWTRVFWTDSVLVALAVGAATLLLCPLLACAWLLAAAERAAKADDSPPRGFPVVTRAAPEPPPAGPPRRRRVDV